MVEPLEYCKGGPMDTVYCLVYTLETLENRKPSFKNTVLDQQKMRFRPFRL